jgi:hypothetical protein
MVSARHALRVTIGLSTIYRGPPEEAAQEWLDACSDRLNSLRA